MAIMNFLEKVFPLKSTKTSVEVDTIFDSMKDELKCKEMAFYIATSYIANTISKCEFKVYENKKEVKNELYYSLNVKANPNDTASRLKNKIITKLYYDGEALIFQDKEGSNNLFCADSFNPLRNPLKGDIYTQISLNDESKTFTKKSKDVYYFNLENDSSFPKVKNLITDMYDDYQEILSYAIQAYKLTNSEKWILEIASVQAGDKDFNERYKKHIEGQLEKFINNPKAVFPQFNGYNLKNVLKSDKTADSTDIRNIKKDVMETVAEAFKMPVSMLYGNMTNVKEIISHYLTFTIDPIAKMISEELTAKSFTIDDWKKGCYIKVDTTNINHLDIFEIASEVEKTISTGLYCIDEIRDKLGESTLDTDFSKKHFITKNYSFAEDALNELKGGDS